MSGPNFETAEIGDRFERNRGMVDEYEVVDIKEIFGDRQALVLESEVINTDVEQDTSRTTVRQADFESEFVPVEEN